MSLARRLPNGTAGLLGLAVVWLAATAHIGSPDVYFKGLAGPYEVGVVVRPPGVVPGQVDVVVQVNDAVDRVTVQPVYWETSTGGAPQPDLAQPVAGEPGTYATRLWLMTTGSYSIAVAIRGARGMGAVNIPVLSTATRELPMSRALGACLLVLGAFLVFGLLSIIGAGSREATLDPGAPVDARRRMRARVAMGSGAAIFALALLGGNAWWRSSARDYQRIIYVPPANTARIVDSAGQRVLHLTITARDWLDRKETPLVPDHGKLVHLFLVRAPGMDAFAHLHPVTRDSNDFRVAVPPLPPGTYRLYADIVHQSGFAETLVDTLAIAGDAPASFAPTDSDDSWVTAGARGDYTRVALGRRIDHDLGSRRHRDRRQSDRAAPLHGAHSQWTRGRVAAVHGNGQPRDDHSRRRQCVRAPASNGHDRDGGAIVVRPSAGNRHVPRDSERDVECATRRCRIR